MGGKKGLICLSLFIFCLAVPQKINAQATACNNRYLTLVNPVRGRNLWFDNTINPLADQYRAISKYSFSATWLLQYDALTDKEIIEYIKSNFTNNQELGLFLEISPDLALQSRVIYPPLTPWFYPQAVFLSGYSQSERRKLIDTVFIEFKEVYGNYPSSVGAWWIDSYSLLYMKNKYDINSVLIVADQKTTDNYGVWGQWWGVPYYPSNANILVPAQNKKTKQDIVVLQWAQRDIAKAYGEGTGFSNYSLQANDYTERKLGTPYFLKLVGSYLDCSLPIGQITVGLETGMESVGSFPEYVNQLEVLSKIEGLHSVTMGNFSDIFRNKYEANPEKIILKDNISEWILTPQGRENSYLGDKINYSEGLAFTDYFLPDKANYLDRKLPIKPAGTSHLPHYTVLLAFTIGFIIYRQLKVTNLYGHVSIFIFATYLTTLLSYSKFGRLIYFGPVMENIFMAQFVIVLTCYLMFVPLIKLLTKKFDNYKLLLMCFSLAYAADFIVSILRYTQINGNKYFGFALDSLRFVGVKVAPKTLSFVNEDFSPLIAGALLKFDFNSIWENKIIALVAYPLGHLVLGILLYFSLINLPRKLRYAVLTFVFVLFGFYIHNTLTLEPRVVF